jgi:hypothetical protein
VAGVLCAGAAQGWQDRVRPFPPEPPIGIPPMPRPARPIEQMLSATELLASSDEAVFRAAAWRMVQVLKKHDALLTEQGLVWPKALEDLKASPPPGCAPTGADRIALLDERTRPILRAATTTRRDAPADQACPPALGLDVLATIAEHWPSPGARLDAARWLVQEVLPVGEGPPPPRVKVGPSVAASAANRALWATLDAVGGGTESDAEALRGILATGLLRKSLWVEVVAAPTPTRQAMEVSLRELRLHLEGAEKSAPPDDVRAVLDAVKAELAACEKDAARIHEAARRWREAAELAERFLTAVNTEDRAGALACLAPEAAGPLKEAPSLRRRVTGREDVRTVIFEGLGPLREAGDAATAVVHWRLIDGAGREAFGAREIILRRSDRRWLLSEL